MKQSKQELQTKPQVETPALTEAPTPLAVTSHAQLDSYRSHLLAAEQKSIEEYDKALMTLSGGALGVSFVFIKDIIGADKIISIPLLLIAWACWIVSLALVLINYFVSHLALRKAIEQSDAGEIYAQRPGARFDLILVILNPAGGILFLIGLVIFALFALFNIGGA
ncbi:MAG: hypothetical protein H7Z38_21575 [Rubrivivax sp.]|nr:hypothetical protein [Pyrinomonadaceae bacterium]